MYIRYLLDSSVGFDSDFLPSASIHSEPHPVDDHVRLHHIHHCVRHYLAHQEDSVYESFDRLIRC